MLLLSLLEPHNKYYDIVYRMGNARVNIVSVMILSGVAYVIVICTLVILLMSKQACVLRILML